MASAFVFTVSLRDRTWLAQLRGPEAKHALSWGLPGGRLEEGEHAVTAAVREFYEEVGIVVPRNELHPILYRGGRSLFLWPVIDPFEASRSAPMAHESAAHAWMPLNYCPSPATSWLKKMHREAVAAFNTAEAMAKS